MFSSWANQTYAPIASPPARVQLLPLQLKLKCKLSMILLVLSPTHQISIGIKLLCQQYWAEKTCCKFCHVPKQYLFEYCLARYSAAINDILTWPNLSAISFYLFQCPIKIQMLSTDQAIHHHFDRIGYLCLFRVRSSMTVMGNGSGPLKGWQRQVRTVASGGLWPFLDNTWYFM